LPEYMIPENTPLTCSFRIEAISIKNWKIKIGIVSVFYWQPLSVGVGVGAVFAYFIYFVNPHTGLRGVITVVSIDMNPLMWIGL
jgi:hypothetical protein